MMTFLSQMCICVKSGFFQASHLHEWGLLAGKCIRNSLMNIMCRVNEIVLVILACLSESALSNML